MRYDTIQSRAASGQVNLHDKPKQLQKRRKRKTIIYHKTTRNNEREHAKSTKEQTKIQRNPHSNVHKIKINMINKVFNLLSLIRFANMEERHRERKRFS